MPRLFTAASSEYVVCSDGDTTALTGFTVASIIRAASDGVARNFFARGSSATSPLLSLRRDAGNQVRVIFNAGCSAVSTTTVVASNGWCFVAATKASGTNTPRCHIYKYAAGTWAHENFAISAGTGSDPGAMDGTNHHLIGARYLTGTPNAFFDGDIAAVGYWSSGATAPTDQAIEALAFSRTAWWSIPGPRGIWLLDQATTGQKVVDLSGNGANESSLTGTAVSTAPNPHFSRGRRAA